MKKLILLLFLTLFVLPNKSFSQTDRELLDSLTTIDSDLRKLFPRWKLCEPDLQVQMYKAFELLGYAKSDLSMQEIEVLAAPRKSKKDAFEILLITCGKAGMKSNVIEKDLSTLASYISGEEPYDRSLRKVRTQATDTTGKEYDIERTYCLIEIPTELPVKPSQASAIQDYMKPTDKNQAFVISLFEQNMKIGETGFWLTNKVGNDEVGYQFWTAGESKLFIRRPLYINTDSRTRGSIPYLVNVFLGGVYRINSGLNNDGSLFGWLPERTLNTNPSGRLKAGVDIHMPFQPELGVSLNVELPLSKMTEKTIDADSYGSNANDKINNSTYRVGWDRANGNDPRTQWEIEKTAHILQATGQFTMFYNWWLDEGNPENFFRFDLGMSYSDVREFAWFRDDVQYIDVLTNEGVKGLRTYKNSEFGDWIFAKMEYRNQSVFPFGASMQYSNQHLLAKGFIPLLGNWLLLEAKYSTPLRGRRAYELGSFFMISPVFRITL